ncbi:MAG: hypothetical protein ACYCY0_07690 [Acidithiobacillus ferrivorans]
MFEQAFKNIDDILHKDAGSSSSPRHLSGIRKRLLLAGITRSAPGGECPLPLPCRLVVGSRLIADIQQRKANDIIRPPAAIRPLDANDGITAFSDMPAPTVFIDHQGDPASPNSSKNRLCRFLSTSDSLSNGAIVA